MADEAGPSATETVQANDSGTASAATPTQPGGQVRHFCYLWLAARAWQCCSTQLLEAFHVGGKQGKKLVCTWIDLSARRLM